MGISFLLSMVSKLRLVQSKLKPSHEQKCLGKMCCPSVDYTFLGCWASVRDKGSGETAMISVITRLVWSETFVLQLAHRSWLRQSAICAVSVGLSQRLRAGQSFDTQIADRLPSLHFWKTGKGLTLSRYLALYTDVLKGTFIICSLICPWFDEGLHLTNEETQPWFAAPAP